MTATCLTVDVPSTILTVAIDEDCECTEISVPAISFALSFLPLCPANLQGPAGAHGSDFLFGTASPDDQNGVSGDIYLVVN